MMGGNFNHGKSFGKNLELIRVGDFLVHKELHERMLSWLGVES